MSKVSNKPVLILIWHLHARTPLRNAIELPIQMYQLWAGLHCHILENTQPCPWIPDQWPSHLRMTMTRNCTQICYSSWTILPLRQNDWYLMDDFVDQNFSKTKLEQLNTCRMYLQVTTLAEVLDHMGAELLPQAFPTSTQPGPNRLDTISMSTLHWPNATSPLPTCWHIWPTTICTLYTGSCNGTCLQQQLAGCMVTYI